MKYVINISKRVGENLFDNIFVNVYENKDNYLKALTMIEKTFQRLNLYINTTIKDIDNFEIAEINLKFREEQE